MGIHCGEASHLPQLSFVCFLFWWLCDLKNVHWAESWGTSDLWGRNFTKVRERGA